MTSAIPITGFPTSGGSYVVGPGSGTSGNWYIEEQYLDIEYYRVVQEYDTSAASGSTLEVRSLSGNGYWLQRRDTIQGTELNVKVRAGYIARYELGTIYPSATETRLQTFAHTQLPDVSGRTYGTLTSGMLGPAGIITTIQPYYFRRPLGPVPIPPQISSIIVDATNNMYLNVGFRATPNAIVDYDRPVWGTNHDALDPSKFKSQLHHYKIEKPHRFCEVGPATAWGGKKFSMSGPIMPLVGPYSTDQETGEELKTLINIIADFVRDGDGLVIRRPIQAYVPAGVFPPIPSNNEWHITGYYGARPEINPNPGPFVGPFWKRVPYYDISRHG